jgi:hypothetical protein
LTLGENGISRTFRGDFIVLTQIWHRIEIVNTMRSKRLWRYAAVSLIAAGPAGGFMFGLMHTGDPDPNPIGRVFYACIMAVQTPLHAGFPPRHDGGAAQSFNAWPHIAISYLLIFGWFVYRDWKSSQKPNAPNA